MPGRLILNWSVRKSLACNAGDVENTPSTNPAEWNQIFTTQPSMWNVDNHYYTGGSDITCKFEPSHVSQVGNSVQLAADYVGGVYHSAYLDSKLKFSFQYGYVEIRCKVPQVPYLWSNLYLADDLTQPWPVLGEIDILQVLGILQNSIGVHGGADPDHHVLNGYLQPAEDWHSDYHVFACAWWKNRIIWYTDGIEIFRSNIYVPQNPLYLYLTFKINETILGQTGHVNSSDFPQIFDVDYLKIYQRG